MNEKRGLLIKKTRELQKLTLQELADKLSVKVNLLKEWEEGASCPNTNMIKKLSKVLSISETDLINGELTKEATMLEETDQKIENLMQWKKIGYYLITIALLIGTFISLFCDYLIFGSFSWSLIVLGSVFMTFSLISAILLSKKKIVRNILLVLSLLIVPYIFFLSKIIGVPEIFKIGGTISIFSIIGMWIIYFIISKLKHRKLFASGLSILVLIPIVVGTNVSISYFIPEVPFDLLNTIINTISLLFVSIIVFIIDLRQKES